MMRDSAIEVKGRLEVVDNKMATVTLARPDHLNAFGNGLHAALEKFLHRVNDASEVDVAVLTGAGVERANTGRDMGEQGNRCAFAPRDHPTVE